MESKRVLESSPILDSIVICAAAGMYGSESNVPGWFNTFVGFGQQQEHYLFKTRTAAIAGPAYCNMKIADRLDVGFTAFSLGLSWWGVPGFTSEEGEAHAELGPYMANAVWANDVVNSSGIEFKVGQDIKLSEKCMGCPPGYGVSGDGAADGGAAAAWGGTTIFTYWNQGVPFKSNRFNFKTPIRIPRNETIECRLLLSEYAQHLLTTMAGPDGIYMNESNDADSDWFPARFGITASLWGIREVMRRGELEA